MSRKSKAEAAAPVDETPDPVNGTAVVFALARIGFRIADSQGEVVERVARTLCQTDHFHPIGPLDPDEMGPCKWDADCNEIAWQPNWMAYTDQARAVIATLMEAAPCS